MEKEELKKKKRVNTGRIFKMYKLTLLEQPPRNEGFTYFLHQVKKKDA